MSECVPRGNSDLRPLPPGSPPSGHGQISRTSRGSWDPVEGPVRCQLGPLSCLGEGAERHLSWPGFVWGVPAWERREATQSDADQG